MSMEQVEKFVLEFFKSLKCNISREGDIIIIENVPKSFEDLFGQVLNSHPSQWVPRPLGHNRPVRV